MPLPPFADWCPREDDPPVGSEQNPPVVVLVILPLRQQGFLPAVKFDVLGDLDLPHRNEARLATIDPLVYAVSNWGCVVVSVTPSDAVDRPSRECYEQKAGSDEQGRREQVEPVVGYPRKQNPKDGD